MIPAVIASAALALGLPALASGAALTESAGKLLAVGSIFTATSTNAVAESETFGTLKCEEEAIASKLTVNNGSTVEAVSGGAGSSKGCTVGGKAAQKTNPKFNSLKTTTPGNGTLWMTFEIDWPQTSFPCHYEGSGVSFTYTSGTNVIHASGSLSSASIFCGWVSAKGTYALFKSGVALKLD